jgi:UDP-N-acetylglucosamine--N-acetylmuramyl-(pentapeptide) pyrophosphoryl-undecaprenol N-acetylglucosamine transferase
MKIVFTGGGTGGHFYPIIAVAQAITQVAKERHLVDPKLYYLSNSPYDAKALFENNIEYRQISAGKWRRYFSLLNFTDTIKTGMGILKAVWQLYFLYPDIIFSKGGYAAFPTLFAARLLKIPIFIHESDSHPGRVSLWSAKFAIRIALSYPEAIEYFPKEKAKAAITGNPIRDELLHPISVGAHEFLKLDKSLPLIYVTGGSLGAAKINDVLLDILPQLVEKYQIIHQVGEANLPGIQSRASYLLTNNPNRDRYKPFAVLNTTALRMIAGVTNLAISRAGSTIFEIATWEIPAIIIPIPEAISHDQRINAFTYARSGAAIVVEQDNLTASVLLSEINRLLNNPKLLEQMKAGAKQFARPDASRTIAGELLNLALEHER